jgi:hypothetical protein
MVYTYHILPGLIGLYIGPAIVSLYLEEEENIEASYHGRPTYY